MGISRVEQLTKKSNPRLGRPPGKIKKVTRSIRIPEDVDAFLAEYCFEHGMCIGEAITEVVIHFRAKGRPR